jgi:hypothetical protein
MLASHVDHAFLSAPQKQSRKEISILLMLTYVSVVELALTHVPLVQFFQIKEERHLHYEKTAFVAVFFHQ